jgi:hypothetical protein
MTMSKFEIVETTRWTLRGRKTVRTLVGQPSWEALKAWRDGQTIGAPSALWLRDAASDALDEIERREP